MRLRAFTIATATLAVLGTANATCYTVYDSKDQQVYHALRVPVDMSRPLREALASKYPGGHLVFTLNNTDCPAESAAGLDGLSPASGSGRESTQAVLEHLAAAQNQLQAGTVVSSLISGMRP